MREEKHNIALETSQIENLMEVKLRSWLVSARQNAGLTARELSRLLHISESYYCMIERGERQVKMDLTLAAKLSAALDISLEDIVRFERLSSALEK